MRGWMSVVGMALLVTAAPLLAQGPQGAGCPAGGGRGGAERCMCGAAGAGGEHQHGGGAGMCKAASGMTSGMDHAMMARMDSLDARLDSLTAQMRSARGDRKLGPMSEILLMLVDHQREMRQAMHQRMMGGEQGMGAGHQAGARSGQMDCPMVRPDSTPAAGGAHQH